MKDNTKLQQDLGYCFRQPELLETALTHSSYSKEKGTGVRCNERLEFLGDAFFDAIIGEELFRMFPDKEEGWLSRIRSTIVCEKSLAQQARRLEIGSYLQLGHGEEKSGGRRRESILADAMEAVIGAIYLDGGYGAAQRAVLDLFRGVIDDTKRGIFVVYDYKTHLQEVLQAHGITDIRYRLIAEQGPDHDKTFSVGLYIDGTLHTEGKGKSKKQAEQAAAMKALKEDWNEF
ncbi:MAG: ribonuclease III [Firmicutes bacterium]|nr:ribonuclease III [Bacillota bacterium]